MFSAANASHFATMEILVSAGADVNALNRRLQQPLHTVVDGGDGNIILLTVSDLCPAYLLPY